VLALNSGSSSLKFGLYWIEASIPKILLASEAESIGEHQGRFWVSFPKTPSVWIRAARKNRRMIRADAWSETCVIHRCLAPRSHSTGEQNACRDQDRSSRAARPRLASEVTAQSRRRAGAPPAQFQQRNPTTSPAVKPFTAEEKGWFDRASKVY
jgi:hypothetical protein